MRRRTIAFTAFLVGLLLTAPASAASPAVGAAGGVAAATSAPDCSLPVTLTDATGTRVTVDERPKRIVTLQPSDAQTAWTIGIQDRVVGLPINQYTAYLDGREDKTNVKNDDLSVNVEKVVALRPDVVLAANVTDPQTVRKLRQAGLTVYEFGLTESLDQIGRNLETVGRLTGSCQAAADAADEYRQRVATVRRAAELANETPSALYHMRGDYTAGTGTFIDDVLTTAGATNVAAQAGITGYKPLNREVVANRSVDWLVHARGTTVPHDAPYAQTTAVRRNQTIALNENYLNQPGPRVVVPLTRLAKRWHPDALARANETVANVTDTGGSTGSDATTTDSASGFGPGFGAGVGLTALAIGALLARRRR
ncbi:MAG: PGF-CTERM-anchored ABC transporter substrate-binding protein [Haloarculaceae archaeon]